MTLSQDKIAFLDYIRVTFSGATDGDGEDYPLIYYLGVEMFGVNIWLIASEETDFWMQPSPLV
eukprot:CAMPEP_0168314596 /NCGR_PEP_ID=MMETSP0210-20121227/9162_1 /TAXON_ID=40633 /ORGANISM="Condylostoma magnum, Strain COL2" /LENGTH=62 /DNA_ID=CAMNT_0008284437 /DNA_START=2622 /DNA_END=2810 /DNA_ORIENTATION=+